MTELIKSNTFDDPNDLKKDQLVPSKLEQGQLWSSEKECQDGIITPATYEGDSKNLEEDIHSTNTLKRGNTMDLPGQNYNKKLCALTQLQSVSGAEGVCNDDHASHRQVGTPLVPDYSHEEVIHNKEIGFSTPQNPTADPNCNELHWDSQDDFAEVALHPFECDQDVSELLKDPAFLKEISSPPNGLETSHCFTFGTLSSSTGSDLPNEVVTNSVATVSDSSYYDRQLFAVPEHLPDGGPTAQNDTAYSESNSRNDVETDQSVSDFTAILSPETDLSEHFDTSMILNSLGSDTKGVQECMIGMMELPSEDIDQNDSYCAPDLMELLGDLYKQDDAVDFGGEELPSEFPECGSLAIPTTVNDLVVSDEEENQKKTKRSKRLIKKKASVFPFTGKLEHAAPAHKVAPAKAQQKSIWTFLLDSLLDEQCNPKYIKWINLEKGEFKIENGPELAKKWSDGRNRDQLKYEHFARAMRHYYKKGYLSRIAGKKLMYQFGDISGWRQRIGVNHKY